MPVIFVYNKILCLFGNNAHKYYNYFTKNNLSTLAKYIEKYGRWTVI